jgi:hypothetical protein
VRQIPDVRVQQRIDPGLELGARPASQEDPGAMADRRHRRGQIVRRLRADERERIPAGPVRRCSRLAEAERLAVASRSRGLGSFERNAPALSHQIPLDAPRRTPPRLRSLVVPRTRS